MITKVWNFLKKAYHVLKVSCTIIWIMVTAIAIIWAVDNYKLIKAEYLQNEATATLYPLYYPFIVDNINFMYNVEYLELTLENGTRALSWCRENFSFDEHAHIFYKEGYIRGSSWNDKSSDEQRVREVKVLKLRDTIPKETIWTSTSM